MLQVKLNELRENVNVEEVSFEIASRVRGRIDLDSYSLFGTIYLAYLAKENDIKTVDALVKFVDGNLSDNRTLFIRKYAKDAWDIALEIASSYTQDTLVVLLIWMPIETARPSALMETPLCISKLAIELLQISDSTVADFCCGAGSFLRETIFRCPEANCFGIEMNLEYMEISRIRMQLYSNRCSINYGNVLFIDGSKRFDRIFCDSPLGQHNSREYESFCVDIPELSRVQRLDWIYFYNVMKHLNDNGRAVVVTMNGNLFNGGVNTDIRKRFIENGWIEAVITLPANLLSSTMVSVSLIVLSRNNESIRMIDATELATIGRRKNTLSDETIANIVEMVNRDTDKSKSVSIEELKAEDYVINPQRYLEVLPVIEDAIEFNELIRSIRRGSQIKASELDKISSITPTDYQYLMLANIQNGIISDDLPYLNSLDKSMEKYCISNNNLLISKNGKPFKVAIASVPDGKKVLANGNLYVIELDENKVNPYYLMAFLQSEAGQLLLSRTAVGAIISNIPVENLKKMIVPCPSIDRQNIIAEKYQMKMDEIKLLNYQLEKAKTDLKTIFEEV